MTLPHDTQVNGQLGYTFAEAREMDKPRQLPLEQVRAVVVNDTEGATQARVNNVLHDIELSKRGPIAICACKAPLQR